MTVAAAPTDIDEASITSRLPKTREWMTPVVEPRPSPVVERLFRRHVGLIPTVVPYICPQKWAYRPFLFLMRPDVREISEELCSQICFVVARDNACRFCYGSFYTFLRVAGYSESDLHRLERELYLNERDGAQHEALQFAVQISQGRLETDAAIHSLLQAGYTHAAIREIGGVAVLTALVNRIGTMLSVPVSASMDDFTSTWYFDALRPVVRLLLNGWQHVGSTPPPPLDPAAVDGPFAPWISHLQNTCVGRVLHHVTNRSLTEASALPVRTKLLILTVIARGVGSHRIERRARSLLRDRFGIRKEALKTAVKHLRGEAVGRKTTPLLRLARASTRYDAAHIQQTVRDHVGGLSRAEIIDAVSTFGLCNALVRLRALAPLDR